MKKTLLFSFAFVGALAASVVLNSQSVSAASGPCYYGPGTCSVPDVGDCGTHDVLPGRNTACGGTPALKGVQDASAAATKGAFINRIIDLSNNGGRTERGAKFIMRETTGTINTTLFRNLLEQSNVDIEVTNGTGTITSWYDPGKNDFFYDTYPRQGGWSSRPVIKIRQNGVVRSVIEVWCGNMTGVHNEVIPATSDIRSHAQLPDAGPYNPGQSVKVRTWVTKGGPDTSSDWTHVLWYDQNGDSVQNDGAANVIDNISGGPTSYPDSSTDIRNHNRSIDGSKNRICVKLNLHGVNDNVLGGNTSIVGTNPAVDCRGINTTPPDHAPTGTITITPCNPSSSEHLIRYGSISDQNGATQGQVSTSATPTTNNVAGPTASNGTVARTNSGVVTYYLHVRNVLANGSNGSWVNVAQATFNNAACPPTVTLDPDAELTSETIEPGQSISADAVVTCTPNGNPRTSNYRRIFWYEHGGHASRYDNPSDVLVSAARDESSPPTAAKTYCTGSNPFTRWTLPGVPLTGVERVCTSLQLTGAGPNATILGDGFDADCASVVTKYFFQATLGDVNAIACLPAGCLASDPTISAFNLGSGSSYKGSGSQIAAFATDAISEFTSGNDPSSFLATLPKRLTFANSGGVYGGNLGAAHRYHITNYRTTVPVSRNGNETVTAATVGLPGSPNVIHATGNILVTGSKAVNSVGVGNVPNLQWVIADGDIYIDKSVGDATQLNGIYIAMGDIYTCTNGFTKYSLPSSTMATDCSKQLTIKGALIAGGGVKLQRTAGSLSTTPAEIIEYNPFVWMQGINPTSPLPTSTSGKLDFITTLPPIL